jgi:4-alpha-glucanotransferase
MPEPLSAYPRSAGVLLHPTSLPGRGVGNLGEAAHRFVDWLADAAQTLWQVLPLVPVSESGSPYNGLSALAGNPLLVSVEGLAREGLLDAGEIGGDELPRDRVDYPRVLSWKDTLLRRAHAAFREGRAPALRAGYEEFRERNSSWMEDYALFRALREENRGASWSEWEEGVRLRRREAVRAARARLADAVDHYTFQQFLFDREWRALRDHAHARGVRIVGDVPIFVAYDSVDVWAHRDLFALDEKGRPEVVSGVPPDYFSATGQRWGNPLYRWEVMEADGYRWWVERFRRTLEMVDVVRIDHFRGFQSYWQIPAGEETAIRGEWRPGPGTALFEALREELGELPLVAEDLGLITREVEVLRDELGLPGMRVFQFAFGDDDRNPHLPANHPENSVAYTGTHDNDTSLGWLREGASREERDRVGRLVDPAGVDAHWGMIRAVFASRARFAVVPLQDVLGLGSEARMNTPGTSEGNWEWRLPEGALTQDLQRRLRKLTVATSRAPSRPHPRSREPT